MAASEATSDTRRRSDSDDDGRRTPEYPPYAEYSTDPEAPTVEEAICMGHDIRKKHKTMRKLTCLPLPRPARPSRPKQTDVRATCREAYAHQRCMKKHDFVLSDRLEYLSRPTKRTIIYLWRDHADKLPTETIHRLRYMLDADEPFKPDQAYEYFTTLKKTCKKKRKRHPCHCGKKRMSCKNICGGKKFEWARHATVRFARGMMCRLAQPGQYDLKDNMQRLSNIVLADVACMTNTCVPYRCTRNPKQKFTLEMSDKIALWIDGIMQDVDDRMLLMDITEGDDVVDEHEVEDDDNYEKGDAGSGRGRHRGKGSGESSEAGSVTSKRGGGGRERGSRDRDSDKGKDDRGSDVRGRADRGDDKGRDDRGRDDRGKDATGKGTMGKDATGRGGTGKDTTGKDVDGKDTREKDAMGKDAMGKDAQRKDMMLKDATGKDVSGKDTTGKDTMGKNTMGKDTTGKDTTGKDATGKDTTGKDATGKDTTGKDTTGKDATGKDTTGKDTTGKDTTGKDATRKDITGKDAGKEGTGKEDTGKDSKGADAGKGKDDKGLVDGKDKIDKGKDDKEKDDKGKGDKDKDAKGKDGKDSDDKGKGKDGKESDDKGKGKDGKESDEKLKKEDEKRKKEEEKLKKEEEKRKKDEEAKKRKEKGKKGLGDDDPDKAEAWKILHKSLKDKGDAVLHKEGDTPMSHKKASDVLKNPPDMDKKLAATPEGRKLSDDIEKKLKKLTADKTPDNIKDAMRDVNVEAAETLANAMLNKDSNGAAKEKMIEAMQNDPDKIIANVDGAAETSFFAAQRLKKADPKKEGGVIPKVASDIKDNLNDIVKKTPMPRNLAENVKSDVKDTSKYLSGKVTKPDEEIEAYVALLKQMKQKGDEQLVDKIAPKSYKDSADYLAHLTSNEDKINKPNKELQNDIEKKLKDTMKKAPESDAYSPKVMDKVISDKSKLLTSHIMDQAEKKKHVDELVKVMDKNPDKVLLRHGNIKKIMKEGADKLRHKHIDELKPPPDAPVVPAKKIQRNLEQLVKEQPPEKYADKMDDVIKDVSPYLAKELLQPTVVKVCKCKMGAMKPCDDACKDAHKDDAEPCCTCMGHMKTANVGLAPPPGSRWEPDGPTAASAPGARIELVKCPENDHKKGECPASERSEFCGKDVGVHYLYDIQVGRAAMPTQFYFTKRQHHTSSESIPDTQTNSTLPMSLTFSQPSTPKFRRHCWYSSQSSTSISINRAVLNTTKIYDVPSSGSSSTIEEEEKEGDVEADIESNSTESDDIESEVAESEDVSSEKPFIDLPYTSETLLKINDDIKVLNESRRCSSANPRSLRYLFSSEQRRLPPNIRRGSPEVSTTQMTDWHALMISLMWNAEAWRDWMQDNIEKAQTCNCSNDFTNVEAIGDWKIHYRKVLSEAQQWREYNNFSRKLIMRLGQRYFNKKIVSPSRTTVRTYEYMTCQQETLKIIDMFNGWTDWLLSVLYETDCKESEAGPMTQKACWNHYKKIITAYIDVWRKYDSFMKFGWTEKYRNILAEWLPKWQWDGPVWVMSACGAVPSGACVAGSYDGQVIWIARINYKDKVLPGALHPNKHCVLFFADGATRQCSRYQVLCNANVVWVPWRGGGRAACAGAVNVCGGVLAGRVRRGARHLVGPVLPPQNRCHVLIRGRPAACNVYELLVLQDAS